MFDFNDDVQKVLICIVVILSLYLMISYIREDKKKCSDIKIRTRCNHQEDCRWTGKSCQKFLSGVPTPEEEDQKKLKQEKLRQEISNLVEIINNLIKEMNKLLTNNSILGDTPEKQKNLRTHREKMSNYSKLIIKWQTLGEKYIKLYPDDSKFISDIKFETPVKV